MTIWWYCPKCGKVTDEFESVGQSWLLQQELDELDQQSIIHPCPECKDKNDRH